MKALLQDEFVFSEMTSDKCDIVQQSTLYYDVYTIFNSEEKVNVFFIEMQKMTAEVNYISFKLCNTYIDQSATM